MLYIWYNRKDFSTIYYITELNDGSAKRKQNGVYALSLIHIWDPYMSDDEMNSYKEDFLRGYYGKGWREIEKFIDFTLEHSEGRHMSIWQHPFEIIPRETYRCV